MACKLDIHKAFDYLDLYFLIQMFEWMGFGVKRINWIKHCISTLKFSILINREPTEFFACQGGGRIETEGPIISPSVQCSHGRVE